GSPPTTFPSVLLKSLGPKSLELDFNDLEIDNKRFSLIIADIYLIR
ncbi:unnamed protein product, partial [marine sediment metagenome]